MADPRVQDLIAAVYRHGDGLELAPSEAERVLADLDAAARRRLPASATVNLGEPEQAAPALTFHNFTERRP